MQTSLNQLLNGYKAFRREYANDHEVLLKTLAEKGQRPKFMCIACSDSRVDPAVLFQCKPGDIFTVRNVANLVPPYEKDEKHHGTSAALEFGICHLNVKHLIIMGHSQCGGIQAKMDPSIVEKQNDFISNWMGNAPNFCAIDDTNCCAKESMKASYCHAMNFPWIESRVTAGELQIHLWFFDIENAQVNYWNKLTDQFLPLDTIDLQLL